MGSAWAELLNGADADNDRLAALLRSLPGVDETGVAERTAMLWSRSIKARSQAEALDLTVACMDLTTLEGDDTLERTEALCVKAVYPEPAGCPPVAAVCVSPDLAGHARVCLDGLVGGPGVAVAAVATGFPAGRTFGAVKTTELELASSAADEIDIVIDRGAFLAGDYLKVFNEVRAAKAICGPGIRLKTILETGELGSLDAVRRAAWLAAAAGSDFVKTLTGKIGVGATPQSVWVLLQAVADFAEETGHMVGVKAAGGVRSAKDAVRYLVLVAETAGAEWCVPALWRFGASSLLNDVLAQRAHLETGRYWGPDYFSVG